MAASNNPTGLHVTLAISVTVALILALTTYLGYKDLATAQANADARTEEAGKAEAALRTALDDIERLKADLGYQYSAVGTDDDINLADPQNVRSQLKADLARYGKDLQEASVAATLAAMRSTIDQLQTDLAQKDQSNQDMQAKLLALQGQYQGQVDQIQQSQTTSETTLQDFIQQRDETLAQKDQELSTIRADYNREQFEKAQLREQMDRMRQDMQDQIANLERTNSLLRDELDGIKRITFEVPDGVIRNVDNTTRTVWLNLGELDGVRPQVTFSVYDQGHYGVARGPEDVKGSVEVVRVLDSHLSEARILTEQLDRPMAPGDVVYSPIWTPGLVEEFAVIGEIDFEGDGQSDRKQLHDLMDHAGARITLEVGDDGYRQPEDAKITVNTKFLVVGLLPDPAQYAAQDPNLERAKRLQAEFTELETQANQQGVRVVRLNDFLAYMGYKPQQRLFLPGENMPYTIRRGVPATGVTDSVGGVESSSGNTSEIYRRNRATGGGSGLYDN